MSLFVPTATEQHEQFSFPYVDSSGNIVAWRVISSDSTEKKGDAFILPDGTVQATPPAGATASAEIGGAARIERIYTWQQVTIAYTATLVNATRTVTLTLITINGTPVQAGEIDWGDGSSVEFYSGGNTSHQYPTETRSYMISFLAFNPSFAIEGSVVIKYDGTNDQTKAVSVNRLKEFPVTRVTTGTGGKFHFDIATGNPASAPVSSIVHTQPLQTERERHTMMLGYALTAPAAGATFKLYEGFAQAVVQNVSGDLKIGDVTIPAGASLELPPMGSDVKYGEVELVYSAAGTMNIIEWRRSL